MRRNSGIELSLKVLLKCKVDVGFGHERDRCRASTGRSPPSHSVLLKGFISCDNQSRPGIISACMPRGAQMAGVKPTVSPEKPGGATPTMSYNVSRIRIWRPTAAGSPPSSILPILIADYSNRIDVSYFVLVRSEGASENGVDAQNREIVPADHADGHAAACAERSGVL